MAEFKTYSMDFASKPLKVELGRMGGQANGVCLVQYGDTSVLVNVTMSPNVRTGIDYMPLTLEYEEKYYAAGKIKSSKWVKRDGGRPSEEAILTGRLIDRSVRPRFNNLIRNEIQLVTTVLAFDGVNDPDMVALFGAPLALMISDIPWDGPVAGVRIGRVEGKLVFNPTYAERLKSDFDIVVAGTAGRINMIEAGANIVPEKDMADAIEAGFNAFQPLIEFQKKIASEAGKEKKQLMLSGHDEALWRWSKVSPIPSSPPRCIRRARARLNSTRAWAK